MPESPPRLDRAEEGMSIWIVGQQPVGDFAASAIDRIVNGNLGGRPAGVDGERARHAVSAAATLAESMPVLHDISTGGLAVALSEIAIASNVGFEVDAGSVADLFDETPLRFIAVGHGDVLDTNEAHVRIGTMGGTMLDFGDAGALPLDEAAAIWRDAIPRRMKQ